MPAAGLLLAAVAALASPAAAAETLICDDVCDERTNGAQNWKQTNYLCMRTLHYGGTKVANCVPQQSWSGSTLCTSDRSPCLIKVPSALQPCGVKRKGKCNKDKSCAWTGKICVPYEGGTAGSCGAFVTEAVAAEKEANDGAIATKLEAVEKEAAETKALVQLMIWLRAPTMLSPDTQQQMMGALNASGVLADGAVEQLDSALVMNTPDVVTTLAGSGEGEFANGAGTAASFNAPQGMAISRDGTLLFVADNGNNRIRQIVIATGEVSTLAGSGEMYDEDEGEMDDDYELFKDGIGADAHFDQPVGLATSPDGTRLFVTDYRNQRIRQIVIATREVTTLAGSSVRGFADGTGADASFANPSGVAISPDGTLLFVADTGSNLIRQIVIATGEVTTLAGGGCKVTYTYCKYGLADPACRDDDAAIIENVLALTGFTITGCADLSADPNVDLCSGVLPGAEELCPVSCGVCEAPTTEEEVSTSAPTTEEEVSTSVKLAFADGTGADASFNRPSGLATSPDGTLLFVADTWNQRIRQIVIATREVTTIAGSGNVEGALADGAFADGTGSAASFDSPIGVTTSPDGTLLFVADSNNNRIRQIVIETGEVTTIAGSSGDYGEFRNPSGVATAPDGTLFVADMENHRIRQIEA
jgi:sugar lactone lactonase YvrE